MTATKVDIATRSDLPEIMRLLRIMHAESGMFDLDEDCAREVFERAFSRQGGIIGVIRGTGTEIRGIIYVMLSKFWYTQQDHLEELFNFIHPDHRRSRYAEDLIEFAKRCADKIGIPLAIGVLTNQRMEAKVRLYQRRLGTPKGAFFIYGEKWVNDDAGDSAFWHGVFHRKSRNRHRIEVPSLLAHMASTVALPMMNGTAG